MSTFERITQNPAQMGGKACVRNMRVTVGMIVGQIGAGRSIDEMPAEYPYLEREDILQALRDAKAQIGEVVNSAMRGVPQHVTKRGKPAVVVLSEQEFVAARCCARGFKSDGIPGQSGGAFDDHAQKRQNRDSTICKDALW